MHEPQDREINICDRANMKKVEEFCCSIPGANEKLASALGYIMLWGITRFDKVSLYPMVRTRQAFAIDDGVYPIADGMAITNVEIISVYTDPEGRQFTLASICSMKTGDWSTHS